jgi:hypothetical protein
MSEITEILFNIGLFVLCILLATACTGVAIGFATLINKLYHGQEYD